MGSRERRTRDRENTRRRILEAAREMFVHKGYEATTMRAIAERVEYTPTAIYYHFRNKEALLTELCAIDFQALAQAFLRIGRVTDPIERLARIGQTYVNFALDHPMQYQLMFMTPRPAVSKGISRGDPGEDAYGFLLQACREAIQSGRLRPEYDDPDAMAQMLWGTVHGLTSLHIVRQHDDWIDWRDTGSTSEAACTAIVRGMLRSPES